MNKLSSNFRGTWKVFGFTLASTKTVKYYNFIRNHFLYVLYTKFSYSKLTHDATLYFYNQQLDVWLLRPSKLSHDKIIDERNMSKL